MAESTGQGLSPAVVQQWGLLPHPSKESLGVVPRLM